MHLDFMLLRQVLVNASFPSPAAWKGRKTSNVGPLEWIPKSKGFALMN